MYRRFFVIASCIFLSFRTGGFFQEKVTIVGKWETLDDVRNYGELDFYKDSSAVFHSAADTILRYKYWLLGDYLVLMDKNNDTTHNRILKLTNSLLYLETVRKSQKLYRYKRLQD